LQQSPGAAGKDGYIMRKAFSLLTDEGGSLIVFTLMVLALLTIVGLASIRTADTEIEIAGTELKYQHNFYLAEGAAMEAVRRLDADTTMTATTGPTGGWMEMTPGALNGSSLDDYFGGTEGPTPGICTLDADASFLAFYEGLASGSSLDVNKTKLHDITLYGRSQKFGGETTIRLGYRKAF